MADVDIQTSCASGNRALVTFPSFVDGLRGPGRCAAPRRKRRDPENSCCGCASLCHRNRTNNEIKGRTMQSINDKANPPPIPAAARVLRVLVACEFSGIVRDAFLQKGHDAWSCDLLPAEHNSNRHIQGDVRQILGDGWDFLIVAHPPCTRLCNSGVRWLHKAPPGKTVEQCGRNSAMVLNCSPSSGMRQSRTSA
jgi:hypothetical protein